MEVARFNTKQEVAFTNDVMPELASLGVQVTSLCHTHDPGELHVTLVLPDHTRAVRVAALELLNRFEESLAFNFTVSPTLLFADDLADA